MHRDALPLTQGEDLVRAGARLHKRRFDAEGGRVLHLHEPIARVDY
eukprot:CAMPEP_0185379202 /NCGR_PEP_ID=MMETSP1364-20130426/47122_1 /TAXON_ID=38817 /ORGANISM="Gephyrocapsa oceanica, Strain RCC1303" /LENGTH=45 /DNA_ID= /DNA_START= /DNA_END= /DNA_ORIENTATION=